MQSVAPPGYKECYECFSRHVGWGETKKTQPVEIIDVLNLKITCMAFKMVLWPKCMAKIHI